MIIHLDWSNTCWQDTSFFLKIRTILNGNQMWSEYMAKSQGDIEMLMQALTNRFVEYVNAAAGKSPFNC